MYPLLDSLTLTDRDREHRRAGAAARLALGARPGTEARHVVRKAVGLRLVRAGLRLIEA